MQRHQFEKPPYIEELIFRVKPELLEKYIEQNYTHWISALSGKPGFLGGQVWVGEQGTGEVASLYFWENYEDYANLDQTWLSGMKKKSGELMGEGSVQFIGQMKESKKKYLCCEYR